MVVVGLLVIVVVPVRCFALGSVIVIMVTDAELVGAGGEFVDPGPFEGVFGLQEAWIEIGGAAEVEAADIEHAVDGNVAVARPVDPGRGIHPVQAGFEAVELSGAGEVGLVEKQDVGEGDLFLRLLAVVEVLGGIPGVDHGDDAIEPVGIADLGIGEESLCHGAGVGEAGGLDQHAIETILPLEQPAEDAEQIAAHGAAEAAVIHGEDLLVGLDDELVVDAHFAEFVLDDGDPPAVLFGEDAVKKRGLAGAKKAGEHGHGNALVSGHEEKAERRESGRGKKGRRKAGQGWKGKENPVRPKGERSRAVKTAQTRRVRPGRHPAAFWSS